MILQIKLHLCKSFMHRTTSYYCVYIFMIGYGLIGLEGYIKFGMPKVIVFFFLLTYNSARTPCRV